MAKDEYLLIKGQLQLQQQCKITDCLKQSYSVHTAATCQVFFFNSFISNQNYSDSS
jgi:hypothetical protein